MNLYRANSLQLYNNELQKALENTGMYVKYLESEMEQPKQYSDCELSPEDWENPVISTSGLSH